MPYRSILCVLFFSTICRGLRSLFSTICSGVDCAHIAFTGLLTVGAE